ncbi:phosphate ABC transporter permease subunit PstC [Desulforhopalus singaporensis]|uniref:Phosphate transport system permease protein n=1 Tax=Desulforhopalus singaporensis TaxID=91360 RepID=A0A1H0N470_9BACT|nr:phosphate ABC transporter permease subunit PstC [Desulforhopalus singaporensis]SDO87170.1 phosphate ABC transporter membrane protein 1, PhoT family [Desulforhopalus singaporensis]
MSIYSFTLPVIVFLALAAYFAGYRKALAVAGQSGGIRSLHSLPMHYGLVAAMASALPAITLLAGWHLAEDKVITAIITGELPKQLAQLPASELSLVLNEIKNIAFGGFSAATSSPAIQDAAVRYVELERTFRTIITVGIVAAASVPPVFILKKISPTLRARNLMEKALMVFLVGCSTVAILTTLGIVLSVLFEALRFFQAIPLVDFIFGLQWSPQTAIRADQAGSSGAFGAVPVFAGTILIATIAMSVAIPVGLLAAIYLSEYASPRFRTWTKPVLEILAGIPTVVYGFFAALTVAPLIRDAGSVVGLAVSSESALAAGLVMGIMIIPFVSSLSDDVIHAVPQTMRDGSLGLGATRFETIRYVILPAALPGIVGSILLAVSRAIGETMIVVMAAGLSANLSFNPLTAVTTVTVQIVTLLVGDQEFDSPKTLAAFALGLLLFVFTLVLNFIALRVVRKYREQYE